MSKNNQILIGIAVVLVVIFGFLMFRSHSASAPVANGGLPSGTSTSDAALNQDAAAIDAQLKGLDNDKATIDQGINDSSAQ